MISATAGRSRQPPPAISVLGLTPNPASIRSTGTTSTQNTRQQTSRNALRSASTDGVQRPMMPDFCFSRKELEGLAPEAVSSQDAEYSAEKINSDPRTAPAAVFRPHSAPLRTGTERGSSVPLPQRPAFAPPRPSRHQARVESDYSDSDESRGARARRSRTATPPQIARKGVEFASKEQFFSPKSPRSSSNSKSQSSRSRPSDPRAQGKGKGKTQERLRNVETISERSTTSSTHEDYARGRSRDRAPSERARPRARRGHESGRKASSSTASQRSPHDRGRRHASSRSTNGVPQRNSSSCDGARPWPEPDPTRTPQGPNVHQGGYGPPSYLSSESSFRQRSPVSSNRSSIQRPKSSHTSFDRSPLASRSQVLDLHTASVNDMFHNHDVHSTEFRNGHPVEHPRWSTNTEAGGSRHRMSRRGSKPSLAASRLASIGTNKKRPLFALNVQFTNNERSVRKRTSDKTFGHMLAGAVDFLVGKVPGGTGPIIGNRIDAGFHY